MTHPSSAASSRRSASACFIPVFFVASGVRFDLDALLDEPSTTWRWCRSSSPRSLLVRGLPALLYRAFDRRAPRGDRRARPAGDVAAVHRGRDRDRRDLGLIDGAETAALVAAGLLSVVMFPIGGLALLRHRAPPPQRGPDSEPAPLMAM